MFLAIRKFIFLNTTVIGFINNAMRTLKKLQLIWLENVLDSLFSNDGAYNVL